VLSGLPGSGKSRVSAALGELLGEVPIRLDELREQRFPLVLVGRETKYSPAASAALHELVRAEAGARLQAGRSVILDGTFLIGQGREETAGAGRSQGGDVLFVKITAPERVILDRLSRRRPGADHQSDAGIEVYRMMADRIARGENGYSDLEADLLDGRCPGDLLVVDSHAGTVRVATPTALALAVARGLATGSYSLSSIST
jgi:predicted kinase